MKETTDRIRSVYLKNERPIWICEPIAPMLAHSLTIFLQGEIFRERVGDDTLS
jgi:hypothetical protein